ncbi:MAG: winged helix-turn-helix transcriptional regulator [Patescibacteria group bacterium]|nr:winged helix-turn-helix transcriptional regulator [Patescibacteria group bacterium]
MPNENNQDPSINSQQATSTPATPEVQPAPTPEPIDPLQKDGGTSPIPEPISVSPTENPSSFVPLGGTTEDKPTPSGLSALLARAREMIQFRKRKKLEKILELARGKGKITNNDIQKLLRVSDATATRYLSQLVKEGKLTRFGPANNPFYQIAG